MRCDKDGITSQWERVVCLNKDARMMPVKQGAKVDASFYLHKKNKEFSWELKYLHIKIYNNNHLEENPWKYLQVLGIYGSVVAGEWGEPLCKTQKKKKKRKMKKHFTMEIF